MQIQGMLNSTKDICDIDEMYYNGDNFFVEDNSLVIKKNGYIATDTYFNSLSIRKWKKYTVADSFSVELDVKGKCKIYICFAWIDDKNIIRRWGDNTPCYEKTTSKREHLTFEYPDHDKAVIAYFMVQALETDVYLHSFNYLTTKNVSPEKTSLAIGICTYRREEYVLKNLQKLKNDCLEKNKIEVIIADNGQTLENNFDEDTIHLYKNRNYGGSGGFTRCMLEAKKANKYTHILLMDDDILLDSEAVLRTYTLISLLKPEYRNSIIGGGMLVLSDKQMQFESGALYYHGNLSFTQKNANMTTIRNVIQNERERDVNYNAWCYCAIPVSVINDNNLPLPIFIHMDDVEYGVRSKLPIITMNGISVWHPFFSNQRSSHIVYYDVRNKLIVMAEFGGVDIRDYAKKYLDIFYKSIFNYDYYRTIMACRGIEDFCKGIDYLKKLDPIELNNELVKGNKKWLEADESIRKNVKKTSRVIISKKELLKTYLLPGKKKQVIYDCTISDANPDGADEMLIYNPVSDKYCVYKKNFFKMLEAKLACKKAMKLIEKNICDVGFEWRDRLHEITNVEFWNEYLGLENSNEK